MVQTHKNSKAWVGILMALSGAALWGISGVVVQRLFETFAFDPGWLVNVRLIVSGVLLLLLAKITNPEQSLYALFKDRTDLIQLIIFALLGMFGVQYTFFVAIAEGNAATATLLQYLGPAFIVLYVAYQLKRLPVLGEWLALSLAMAGTFLLVTNGSLSGLQISVPALVWGILSAVTAAFYTIYPQRLIQKWGSILIVGWAMLIAGICMTPFQHPWNLGDQQFNWTSISFLLFVILFGTLCSFVLYLDSLRYLSPTYTGLLGMAEPFCSVVVAVIWLNHQMGWFEYMGAACIIGTVIVLSYLPKNIEKEDFREGKSNLDIECIG